MSRLLSLILAAVGTAAMAAAVGCAIPGTGREPQAAVASPELSRIVASGKLRVGMSGKQPPLNFRSKSGELMGLEVDLAHALAGLMGLELELVQRPFRDLLPALSAGEIDLVMSGMTITPERNLRAAFVGPYYLSGKSILTRSSVLAQARSAGDLDQSDLRLAALDGSTSQEFVEAFLPKASLTTTTDYDEAVQLLLSDQVNALVADREIVTLTAFRHRDQKLATLREPLTVEPIGIAAPPGDALLVNFLENTVGALESSGILSSLRVRWLERNDWIDELP